MKNVARLGDFKVASKNESMFFVNDANGTCYGYFDSLRKAVNKMKKIASYQKDHDGLTVIFS